MNKKSNDNTKSKYDLYLDDSHSYLKQYLEGILDTMKGKETKILYDSTKDPVTRRTLMNNLYGKKSVSILV